MTGPGDTNREQIQCTYRTFVGDNFLHASLFDVPGLGHTTPDVAWFEKAIVALDAIGPTSRPAGRSTTKPASELR